MRVLFIHGMGRTPLSGLPVLWRLRRQGHTTSSFGYCAAVQDFRTIRDQLVRRLIRLAERGPYVVVAHSLGGVLLRGALAQLPEVTPRPRLVFLLGSPVQASRWARRLQDRLWYRVLTGDCGQLLASPERMAAIGPVFGPCLSLVGTRGLSGVWGPFQGEPNDGVVAISEAAANWITQEIRLPVVHTLLPASGRVAAILLDRLRLTADGGS